MLQNRKLEYKREQLEREIQDLHEAFDSALLLLRKEKLSLEVNVKAAQIKRLTFQQELQLLKVRLHDDIAMTHLVACNGLTGAGHLAYLAWQGFQPPLQASKQAISQ